jgi:hypothetical protein
VTRRISLEDQALDSVLHHRDVEIEENADLLSGETQVGKQLGLMQGADLLDSSS